MNDKNKSHGNSARLFGSPASCKPDVVLLDLALPDQPGAAVARQLQALDPAPQCLVYSAYDDPAHIHAVLAAGAAGYLLQTELLGTVVAAMRAVAHHLCCGSTCIYGEQQSSMRSGTGGTLAFFIVGPGKSRSSEVG